MRELKKGSLGMLLLHLLRVRPSYGYELCLRLSECSDGTLAFDEGAIYPLLHEYERQGLVVGYWETSEYVGPELSRDVGATDTPPAGTPRKGPRRRYYRLTQRGAEALVTRIGEWRTFADAVKRVLESSAPDLAIG